MTSQEFIARLTEETRNGWVQWLAPSIINEYLDPKSQETMTTVSGSEHPILVFFRRDVSSKNKVCYHLLIQKQYPLNATVLPPLFSISKEEEGGALETLWNEMQSQIK